MKWSTLWAHESVTWFFLLPVDQVEQENHQDGHTSVVKETYLETYLETYIAKKPARKMSQEKLHVLLWDTLHPERIKVSGKYRGYN